MLALTDLHRLPFSLAAYFSSPNFTSQQAPVVAQMDLSVNRNHQDIQQYLPEQQVVLEPREGVGDLQSLSLILSRWALRLGTLKSLECGHSLYTRDRKSVV